MADLSGKSIGRYRLTRAIGIGATSTVYLAEHEELHRPAAIKVLHPHLVTDSSSVARFRREAESVASLKHPNIVSLYDFVVDKEGACLILEYVDGWTLRDLRNNAPAFPTELSIAVITEVCMALKAAHDAGFVHRDIKPENILVTHEGNIKLTDFGIARLLDSDKMTMTGALLGSPNFMAPEQIEGYNATPASDVFALGVLLYYLMVGKLPFDAQNHVAVFKNVLAGQYIPPEAQVKRVPYKASRIIEKCLSLKVEARYASASEMLKDLKSLDSWLGFDDPAEEFRQWVTSRESYMKAYDSALIDALCKAARKGIKEKNSSQAFAALNQILAIDSLNAQALSMLSFLRKHNRSVKAMLFAVIGIILFICGVLLWPKEIGRNKIMMVPVMSTVKQMKDTVGTKYAQVPKKSSAAISIKQSNTGSFQDKPIKTTPIIESKSLIVQVPAKDSVQRAGKPKLFKFFAKPWAKVYIDDVYIGKTPFIGEAVLSQGRHTIRLENPYCESLSDTLEVSTDVLPMKHYELKRLITSVPIP